MALQELGGVPIAGAVGDQRPGDAPGQHGTDHHGHVDGKRRDEAGADVRDGEVKVPARVVGPARRQRLMLERTGSRWAGRSKNKKSWSSVEA